jgi:hypothetical protein
MLFFKKKNKANLEKDELVRFLIKSIQDYHTDYQELLKNYNKSVDEHTNTIYEYFKLVKCIRAYIDIGASDRFRLLLKEFMIGEETSEEIKKL